MSAKLLSASLIDAGEAVSVMFDDGSVLRFHAIWLRDNALDNTTRAANGQKLLRLCDLPDPVVLTAAEIDADGERLALTFGPDGHVTDFLAAWLLHHAYDRPDERRSGWVNSEVRTWSGGGFGEPVVHDFPDMTMAPEAQAAMLAELVELGFTVVGGLPTEDGSIFDLAELIGPVRETNYGRLFDVRAEVNPVNLAYSGLGLQAHTDNPYRDPVPTVQILHCLRNSVDGGDSAVVDGFAVAQRLRDADPGAFDLLTSHSVRYRYDGDGVTDLQSKRPIIEVNPDGQIIGVRFNNRSAAPFTDIPYDRMADFYRAYRAFADIVDDPDMALTFRLDPGMAFIVDNRRVMHSRTAFAGGGERWLQGCYADMDSVNSALAIFRRGQSAESRS